VAYDAGLKACSTVCGSFIIMALSSLMSLRGAEAPLFRGIAMVPGERMFLAELAACDGLVSGMPCGVGGGVVGVGILRLRSG